MRLPNPVENYPYILLPLNPRSSPKRLFYSDWTSLQISYFILLSVFPSFILSPSNRVNSSSSSRIDLGSRVTLYPHSFRFPSVPDGLVPGYPVPYQWEDRVLVTSPGSSSLPVRSSLSLVIQPPVPLSVTLLIRSPGSSSVVTELVPTVITFTSLCLPNLSMPPL